MADPLSDEKPQARYDRAWYQKRGYEIRANNRKMRRQLIRDAGSLTKDEWEAIKADYNHCCAYCGDRPDKLTQDHVIPVSRGGLHTRDNIVPACHPCNASKRDRTPDEWGKNPRKTHP
jgi:5-methylcytosine-specific restriction endonuclease McrA